MKIVTSFQTLMLYARALGQAERNKDSDPEAYEKAKAQHDEYRNMCFRSDVEMRIDLTVSDLSHPEPFKKRGVI